jgi:hypothetical protein
MRSPLRCPRIIGGDTSKPSATCVRSSLERRRTNSSTDEGPLAVPCEIGKLANGTVAGSIRLVVLDEDDIPHLLSPRQVTCQ